MHYVYILKSLNFAGKTYVGYTTDIHDRLRDHNRGSSAHTSKYAPWKIISYFAFENQEIAYNFEKYLKSHSGRAFAKKRFNIKE